MSVYAPAQRPIVQPGLLASALAFIKRHPVDSYYALTFTISWGVLLLIIYANGGLPTTREAFAGQVSLAIPAMLGGPAIAGILMTGFVSGKAGYRDLLSRLLRWRVGVGWYAVALLSAPLVFVVVHVLLSAVSPIFCPASTSQRTRSRSSSWAPSRR